MRDRQERGESKNGASSFKGERVDPKIVQCQQEEGRVKPSFSSMTSAFFYQ